MLIFDVMMTHTHEQGSRMFRRKPLPTISFEGAKTVENFQWKKLFDENKFLGSLKNV